MWPWSWALIDFNELDKGRAIEFNNVMARDVCKSHMLVHVLIQITALLKSWNRTGVFGYFLPKKDCILFLTGLQLGCILTLVKSFSFQSGKQNYFWREISGWFTRACYSAIEEWRNVWPAFQKWQFKQVILTRHRQLKWLLGDVTSALVDRLPLS